MPLVATYIILVIHVMDTSIANVALVSITTDLGLDAYDGQWMITAFSIGMGVAVPFVPKFLEWLGGSTSLTVSLSISLLSLALCGMADSLVMLVLARFVQGLSSGVVVLLLQRLMLQQVGADNRAYGLALWSSALFIAPSMGPFVGAAVVHFLSWRWLFLGQVPLLLGAISFLTHELSWGIAKSEARPSLTAAALITAVMMSIQVGLDSSFTPDVRRQSLVLPCVLGGIVAAVLLRHLNRGRGSLFDWSFLRSRRYVVYMTQSALMSSISTTTAIMYTLWLLLHLDLPVLDVAKVLVGSSLIAGTCSPFIGRLRQKHIYPYLIMAGLVCFIVSFLLCTRLEPESATLFDLVLPRLFAGAGTALCSPAGYLAVAEFSGDRVLAANSLGLYLRTFVDTSILMTSAATARKAELLFSERAVAAGFGAPWFGIAEGPSPALAHHLLRQIAGTQAMHLIYWIGLVIVVGLLINMFIHNPMWSRGATSAAAT